MDGGDVRALEVKRSIMEREVRCRERKTAEMGQTLRESTIKQMQAHRKFEAAKAKILAAQGKTAPPRLALVMLQAGSKKLRDSKKVVDQAKAEARGAKDRYGAQLASLNVAKAREEKGIEILRALRRKLAGKNEAAAVEELSEAAHARNKNAIKEREKSLDQIQLRNLDCIRESLSQNSAGRDSPRQGAPAGAGAQEQRHYPGSSGKEGEAGRPTNQENQRHQEFADRIKELLSWNEGGEAGIRIFYRSVSGKAMELEVTQRTEADGVSIAIESPTAPDRALILVEKRAILDSLKRSGIEVRNFTVTVREL